MTFYIDATMLLLCILWCDFYVRNGSYLQTYIMIMWVVVRITTTQPRQLLRPPYFPENDLYYVSIIPDRYVWLFMWCKIQAFMFRENFILFRETFSCSEKMLLISEKHFHIQSDFLYLKKSSISREIAYLKKLFYIHRKFLYL